MSKSILKCIFKHLTYKFKKISIHSIICVFDSHNKAEGRRDANIFLEFSYISRVKYTGKQYLFF